MKKSPALVLIPLLAALLLTLLAPSNASAATTTITAAQSGNWSATTTWTGGVVPTTQNVTINGAFTVTVDTASAACGTLLLGSAITGTHLMPVAW